MNAVAPCALLPLLLVVDLPLWAFCLINAVAWAGIGWFAVLWFGALQTEFPAQVQGRVFSLESLATFGLQPLGLAIAPVVAAAVGLTAVAVVASVVMIVTTYAVFLVPGVARFRSPDPVPAPALTCCRARSRSAAVSTSSSSALGHAPPRPAPARTARSASSGPPDSDPRRPAAPPAR